MNNLNDPSIWNFPRRKKKNILLSIIYSIGVFLPLGKKNKFVLFSNLSWIFKRMAYEFFSYEKMETYTPHNVRNKFIKDKLSKDINLIDFGCGEGNDTRLLAPYVKSIIGIDHNAKVLEIAKNLTNEKNVTYINKNIHEWLPNSNEKYEIAICSHVIEHLDSPVNFLTNCKNFFKYIYVEVPDNDQDEHSFLRVQSGLDPLFNDADHIWEFKRKDLERLFDNLELEIVSKEQIYGIMRFWLKSK